jgi:hypothetical protein
MLIDKELKNFTVRSPLRKLGEFLTFAAQAFIKDGSLFYQKAASFFSFVIEFHREIFREIEYFVAFSAMQVIMGFPFAFIARDFGIDFDAADFSLGLQNLQVSVNRSETHIGVRRNLVKNLTRRRVIAGAYSV